METRIDTNGKRMNTNERMVGAKHTGYNRIYYRIERDFFPVLSCKHPV
jgi:hypothetical protein